MRRLLVFLSLFLTGETAKILGVFSAPGYSQFILAEVLMKEVARRGHDVTVISSFLPKDAPANYKTILTTEVIKATSGYDLFTLADEDLFKNIKLTYWLGNDITEKTLKDEKVQALLHSDEHFDLVIVEEFFSDAMKGFATHFGAPLVLFSSMGLTEWTGDSMGYPFLPSINAVTYTSYTNTMTFTQRVWNLVGTVYDYLYKRYVNDPIQKEYLERYFPKPMDFDEVVYNASLMFLNSHVTTSENSLLPYNMVEIGGFHVVQTPLSKDIQEFLDGAKDGAVLFSLGSNLKSANLKEETLKAIFTVLGGLKQKVLWKFERDLPNKPNNIHISKWLNQRDILAHPNIKLFITHGGLLSTIEAVFHGVPMVGIPVFADQRMNMARAQKNGIARAVPFSELSLETLGSAVKAVLEDPKYQTNANKISKLMNDRPMKPLDLALYWIEHTIRHKGARFEPASLRMTWLEVYMIDVLLFVVFNLFIVIVIVKCCLKYQQCTKKIKTKQQ